MRTYEEGKFYEFAVEGIVKDDYGRDFIYLSDGEIQTYRVKPYDFQIEWESANLPPIIKCYVTGLNARDLPYLEQCKEDALATCYTEKGTCFFKLLAKQVDANTNIEYWELNDAFGFYHRLYLNDITVTCEIGEEIELQVNGVIKKEKNIAYLDLSLPQNKVESTLVLGEETPLDPRTESRFGYESNTMEFKSTIVYPAGETEDDIDTQISIILKTIAGFQNKNGGKLYVGVDDSGNICGINEDFKYLNSSKYDEFVYPSTVDGY
ncbi:MAG: ATP-binding protein [Flavobacteriaceae bacterium]|nr:ATP-binding protein [Flavobacteriaceae bacterium]